MPESNIAGGDFAAVALAEENDRALLRYRWFSEIPAEVDREGLASPFRIGQGPGGQARDRGYPTLVHDYPSFPHALPAYVALGIKSAAAAPIRVRGGDRGRAQYRQPAAHPPFNESHLSLLELVARQLGVALECDS